MKKLLTIPALMLLSGCSNVPVYTANDIIQMDGYNLCYAYGSVQGDNASPSI